MGPVGRRAGVMGPFRADAGKRAGPICLPTCSMRESRPPRADRNSGVSSRYRGNSCLSASRAVRGASNETSGGPPRRPHSLRAIRPAIRAPPCGIGRPLVGPLRILIDEVHDDMPAMANPALGPPAHLFAAFLVARPSEKTAVVLDDGNLSAFASTIDQTPAIRG